MAASESFHVLLGRLAADGGELLQRLAVEHEREVALLHAEVGRLQEEIINITGRSATTSGSTPGLNDSTENVGTEASTALKRSLLKNGGGERQQPRLHQQRRQKEGRSDSRSGQPDEKALAKALSFVDALDDDRSLMRVIACEPLHAEGEKVLKVAAEIAELARERRDPQCPSHWEAHLERDPHRLIHDDDQFYIAPRAAPFRSNYGSWNPGDLQIRAELAAQSSPVSPGIKLSNISPPVKAPDRMLEPPEPPAMPEEDESVLQAKESMEVLNERLKLSMPGRTNLGIPVASGGVIRVESARSPAPERSPGTEDVDHEHSVDLTLLSELEDQVADLRMKTVPLFLNAVSKPPHELLPTSDLYYESPRGLSDSKSPSGMPSRETTTWQPQMEIEDPLEATISPRPTTPVQQPEDDTISSPPTLPVNAPDGEPHSPRPALLVEPESPDPPGAEAEGHRKTKAASEDWRSVLQVQGAKWRPSGDDGVSIAMYLESTPTVARLGAKAASGAPTSI